MTPHQQEQIDNYHSGLMNDQEVAAFESKLDADPSLKAESDLQADIINGLKEYRKAELKTRLEAINVGPTWVGFMQQSTLVKSLGGVIVASLIGGGIYVFGEKEEISEEGNVISIDAPIAESIAYDVIALGEETSPVEDENITLEKPTIDSNESTESAVEPINDNNTAVDSKDEEVAVEETNVAESDTEASVFTPDVSAPEVALIDEEDGFQSSGLDELPENTSIKEGEEPIDVKSEQRKGTIKYKYYDGKLFLSGDFNKNTYEILEINSASGRRIYVYYLSEYYSVGISDRLIELPKVSSKRLIEELELIRKNK